MKTARRICTVVGVSCVLAVSPAAADGWKFPSLNPFQTEEREESAYVPTPGPSNVVVDEEPPTSGFKFPKLTMPKLTSGERAPGEPSAMQRFGQGTKNFFSKTADALTPWDNDKPQATRSRTATGVRRTYNGSPNATKEEEKGFFSSWFGKDEPEEPRTVNGFIAQPRPKF